MPDLLVPTSLHTPIHKYTRQYIYTQIYSSLHLYIIYSSLHPYMLHKHLLVSTSMHKHILVLTSIHNLLVPTSVHVKVESQTENVYIIFLNKLLNRSACPTPSMS